MNGLRVREPDFLEECYLEPARPSLVFGDQQFLMRTRHGDSRAAQSTADDAPGERCRLKGNPARKGARTIVNGGARFAGSPLEENQRRGSAVGMVFRFITSFLFLLGCGILCLAGGVLVGYVFPLLSPSWYDSAIGFLAVLLAAWGILGVVRRRRRGTGAPFEPLDCGNRPRRSTTGRTGPSRPSTGRSGIRPRTRMPSRR